MYTHLVIYLFFVFFGFLIFYEHFFLRFCVFTVIKIYEKSDK